MPQILVRNVDKETLVRLSDDMISALVEITGTDRDDFTLELMQVESITEPYPFVDIYWFDRPLEIQDAVSKVITDALMGAGLEELGLCFHELSKRKYYYNGQHFA